MTFKNLKIHPAGPIVWAGIVAIIFYFWYYGQKTVPAMPDAGLGGSVRYGYAQEFSTAYDTGGPDLQTYTNPFRGGGEPIPKQPVINQDHVTRPWYEFLNEMFHSQSNAYLQERAYP